MRELGRGGSLVAATIAALHSRSTADAKPCAFNSRTTTDEKRNFLLPLKEGEVEDFPSQRFSGASERPASTASEASERDSASVRSSEAPPPRDST